MAETAVSLTLPPGEIHIWHGGLDVEPGRLEALRAYLSAEERKRAASYSFERDRRRFAAARGLLRELLGCYLGCPAAAVRFRLGPFAKPFLDGAGPWFNLSHSGPLLMIALSAEAEVGVDIEQVDRSFVAGRVPEHFFSATEVRTLRSLPVAEQTTAFLRCWTRKEAFIKARGDGLQLPLSSFDVTLAPGEPAALLRTAWSRSEPRRWTLQDLSAPDGSYVAALAIPGRRWRIVRRALTELER